MLTIRKRKVWRGGGREGREGGREGWVSKLLLVYLFPN